MERATTFQTIKWSNYDIVITNPPFSKMKHFMGYIKSYNLKYLLIGFWLFVELTSTNKNFIQDMNWYYAGAIKYINNTKTVPTMFYTNLNKPSIWSKNEVEVIEGKIYNATILQKTNKRNFAKIVLKKDDGSNTFGKYVFGKTNKWLIDNIKDLSHIRYNNVDHTYSDIDVDKIKANEGQETLW